MKGKVKEYLILLVIIALAGTYLYFKRTDQVHYRIPQLNRIDAKAVTSIQIASAGRSITLTGRDRDWKIEPAGFPADPLKVQKMLHDIEVLTLTDLVSDSKNYDRYELGEKDRATVKAFAGTSILRQFDVGKVAPSSRHTFVMLPNDPNVYQAKDAFREDFQGDAASFRDRGVLRFAMDDIGKVQITAGTSSATLTRQVPGDKPGKPAVWVNSAGKEASGPDMDLLVSSLSSLECSAFIDGMDKGGLGTPSAVVTLTGSRDYFVSIYPKKDAVTPVTSSGTDYVFTLQDYNLEAIQKAVAKLVKAP